MAATKDERGNGKWRYQKVVVNPTTGKRYNLRKRGFSSKKAAEIAESLAVSLVMGSNGPNSVQFDDCIKQYIDYKSKRITNRSIEKLERLFNGFIIPSVTGKDMREFSSREVNLFYESLIDFSSSSNYRNKIVELLKSLFMFAEMQYGIVNFSIKSLQRFKVKRTRKQYSIYTMDEFEKFISTFNIEDNFEFGLKVFFSILYWSGLRRGECKALKWNDIDYKSGTIRVDEQFIDKDPEFGRVCTFLKTDHSYRTVYLDEYTMALIRDYFKYKSKNLDFSISDFLFERNNMKIPFPDTTIENRNKIHAMKAGLKRIRVHDFRHSFASLNYTLGVDPKTISTQMGHSSLTITLDTYVNIFDDKVKARADVISLARSAQKKLS
jgi:integrase